MFKLPLVIIARTRRHSLLYSSSTAITAMLHLNELLSDGYDDLASHYRSASFSFKMHRYGDRYTQIGQFYGFTRYHLEMVRSAAVLRDASRKIGKL